MADSPEVVQAEAMGLGKRLVGVFVSPGATFAAVRAHVSVADWLVPLILMAIALTATTYMTMPLQMKMAQTEVAEDLEVVTNAGALIGTPLGVFAWAFVIAAIYLGIARFALGGETTYRHVLAVTCYGSLVGIPGAIVTVPLMLAKESALVQVGFGLLLPEAMAESFLAYFLHHLNFFAIWQYALTAIGLGIVSGISIKKAAIGVFVLHILFAIGSAALAGMAKGLGG